MFRYTAKIICDECGIALINEGGSKNDIPTINILSKRARKSGWEIKGMRCLCEYCKNNAMRPEKIIR